MTQSSLAIFNFSNKKPPQVIFLNLSLFNLSLYWQKILSLSKWENYKIGVKFIFLIIESIHNEITLSHSQVGQTT